MSTIRKPIEFLKNYIPEKSAEPVLQILNYYKVHLTITRDRKTRYGDYTFAHGPLPHRITVNSTLNRYAFLITLIHELAHLVAFDNYGGKIAAHGKEWKYTYAMMLKDFLRKDIFPDDILQTLNKSLHNLPASSCADENLMRVLKKYDEVKPGLKMVEEIAEGNLFMLEKGEIFRREHKLRKRIQCTELKSGKIYLFNPLYEVREYFIDD